MSKQVKFCATCGTYKSISEFHRNKNTYDGLSFRCKDCCVVKRVGTKIISNLKGEEWKDVDGYEGVYQISNKGRLKHILVKNRCEKMINLYKEKTGYIRITLSHKNKRKKISMHR